MRLRVLGTAAGGGVPQWNCACPGCAAARADPRLRRRHASLAVQTGDGHWYVVNATPDIAEQIEASPELHPGPEPRRTPVVGVVLTDAELDHSLGVPRLREAQALRLLATGTVRAALSAGLKLDDVLSPYAGLSWRTLAQDEHVLLDGDGSIAARAIRVSGKRPRYARALEVDGDAWSIALQLTDQKSGTSIVYAPALADWPVALEAALREAACVFIDGTFWDDQEPRRTGISGRTAREMGHLPITGDGGTAARLTAMAGVRIFYTHLNNTNPLIDPAAREHQVLAGMGIGVAQEDAVIDL